MNKASQLQSSLLARITATLLVALSLSCQFSGTAAAQDISGQQLLRQAALDELHHAYAKEPGRVEIEVATLDARLQVPICQEPLQTSVNRPSTNGGRVTVRVECLDSSPWSRYVAASVRLYQDIAVASRALPRGSIIGPGDVILKEQDISTLRGQVIKDPGVAVGQSVRRSVTADTALSLDLLEAPVLVKRGDMVVLIAERGSIAIRETGTALQAGEAGRQIPVRNNSSDRVVQAVVTGAGEVKVIF
jgi:flagella basal body P-ring formation protein FlgA